MKAMMDDANWVRLHGRFDSEKSLSDYIATFPHHLEDNLMPYPDKKVRENRFRDKSRSDVLLIDKNRIPVVVECKQGAPTLENIEQLRGYMKHIRQLTGKKPRGVLVHGGAASLREEVRRAARQDSLKMIRYSLQVGFTPST
jgi:RecB family endonuclease NucS